MAVFDSEPEKDKQMDPFQHFMNSPMMKQNLEQFTYMSGLGADMYWPVVIGTVAVFSSLAALV